MSITALIFLVLHTLQRLHGFSHIKSFPPKPNGYMLLLFFPHGLIPELDLLEARQLLGRFSIATR